MRKYETRHRQSQKDDIVLRASLLERLQALTPVGGIEGFMDDDLRTLKRRVGALEQQEAQEIIRGYQSGAQDKRTLSEALASLLELAAQPLHRHFNAAAASARVVDYAPAFDARAEARDIITAGLRTIRNAPPIGTDEETPRQPQRLWLVSPLEGIDHQDAAMSIALIDNGAAKAGIVHFPKLGRSYAGVPGEFAFLRRRGRKSVDISVRQREFRKIAGTAHGARRLQAFAAFRDSHLVHRAYEDASAAHGLCRIAQGSLDFYFQPVFVPQGALAAAHAVLEGAGGVVRTLAGEPLAFAAGTARAPAPPFVAAASEKTVKTHETSRLVL